MGREKIYIFIDYVYTNFSNFSLIWKKIKLDIFKILVELLDSSKWSNKNCEHPILFSLDWIFLIFKKIPIILINFLQNI